MNISEFSGLWAQNGPGGVIAIGNFDGVHRGHRFLLDRAKALAAGAGRPWGILTFEPHPRALFRPDDPPARLTPHAMKREWLDQIGADFICVLPFNWDLASLSADDFIRDILQTQLQAGHIVVGAGFRFGQLRKGDASTMRAAGLDVTEVLPLTDAQGAISSSRIRQALRQGDIAGANNLLGWHWDMRGRIVQGDGRGRGLGYPTANFALGETIHPAYGVYAARVRVEGEEAWHDAAVNIGIRPMFEIPEAQVESYIFDFGRQIYGQILHVRPVERLRGEAKFASLEDLIAQIGEDCTAVKKILARDG